MNALTITVAETSHKPIIPAIIVGAIFIVLLVITGCAQQSNTEAAVLFVAMLGTLAVIATLCYPKLIPSTPDTLVATPQQYLTQKYKLINNNLYVDQNGVLNQTDIPQANIQYSLTATKPTLVFKTVKSDNSEKRLAQGEWFKLAAVTKISIDKLILPNGQAPSATPVDVTVTDTLPINPTITDGSSATVSGSLGGN